MALSSELSFGWEFSQLPQPPQVFSVRGFEALVPHARTLGCTVHIVPQSFLLVYLHANAGPPGPPAAALLHILSAPAACLHPSYQYGLMFLL